MLPKMPEFPIPKHIPQYAPSKKIWEYKWFQNWCNRHNMDWMDFAVALDENFKSKQKE